MGMSHARGFRRLGHDPNLSLSSIRGFRMVNFLTILFRALMKKKERDFLFFSVNKMTAIDISTKIWRQISEPDCSAVVPMESSLATNAWECPMLEVAAGGWGNTDPQPLAFLFGI